MRETNGKIGNLKLIKLKSSDRTIIDEARQLVCVNLYCFGNGLIPSLCSEIAQICR